MNKKPKPKIILKVLAVVLPVVAVLTASGVVLANLVVNTPGSLNYISPPINTTMQTFTSNDCAAMGTYTTVTLTDNRGNNQQYQIRKMPDGHCWMIDNLKLPGGATLTSENTNLDGSQAADFTTIWASLSTSVQASTTHINGECTADSSVAKANGYGYLTCNGAAYADTNDGFVAYTDPSIVGGNYENCEAGVLSGTSTNSLSGCGYLYNWYTATAGSGKYETISNTSVSSSICPAGWHLPYNTSTNDFAVLNNAMMNGRYTESATNNATASINWVYNGPFMGSLSGSYSTMRPGNYYSVLDYQGSGGYYWSARTYDVSNSNVLVLGPSTINHENYYNKAFGFAIRCML